MREVKWEAGWGEQVSERLASSNRKMRVVKLVVDWVEQMNKKQWVAGRLEASRFILFSDLVSFKKRVPVLKDFSISRYFLNASY